MAGETLTQGTKLQRGDGATPTEIFTSIPGVTAITGLGSGTAAEIDTTDLDSLGKEFLPGLKDEGSLSVSLKRIFGNVQQEGLYTDRDGQVLRNFKILYRNLKYRTFSAFITALPAEDVSPDEIVRGGMTLRISGSMSALLGP
jgi:hypothetical protein